jgi:hypothetical protein
MKTVWTYLFMFISIPPGWLFREPMIPRFGGGSNDSSPIDENNSGAPRWPEREREQCEGSVRPNHLF